MSKWYDTWNNQCHWCNKPYTSKKNHLEARFCSAACKQAHHRAYKKYVTAKRQAQEPGQAKRVTRKKCK